MAQQPAPPSKVSRRMRGFEPAFGLMRERLRTAGESRGFAVARLLTHWAEVVGEDLAAMTRPVKVTYGKPGAGRGATLTLLVASAHAPMIRMQEPRIRDRVNACYGYAAIARIQMTQTAPTGFAEGQADFTHAPKTRAAAPPDPVVVARAAETAAPIRDEAFRAALEQLAQNILTRRKT